MQQYFVEDSHGAIIPPEEWEKVQTEFARRKSLGRKYSGDNIFGSKIVCGDCGTFFGAKTWNSTSKYRRTIYRCNGKYKGDRHCKTPHLTEEQVKSHFVQAINILLENRTELIQNCERVKELTTSCEAIDRELAELHDELQMLADLARRCISQNAETALNQSEYTDRYNAYTSRYEEVSARVDDLEKQKIARQMRAIDFETFLRTMRSIGGRVQAFDEALWSDLVEVVTVHNNDTMTFRFKKGQEIIG